MRNELCPICGRESRTILQLHFNQKMKLPTEVPIRHCPTDNFLFVANGHQESYDDITTLANDSYHSEVAGGNLHSPIAQLQRDHLVKMLGDFFAHSRKVLDFGCGEGWLLAEWPASSAPRFFRELIRVRLRRADRTKPSRWASVICSLTAKRRAVRLMISLSLRMCSNT